MTTTPDILPASDESDEDLSNEEIAVKLGKKLRNIRFKKKLTLEAIAEKLKIRESQLRALEKGDYQSLPEMTYALGFMRAYAKFLELPTEEILEDFKQGMGQIVNPLNQTAITREVPQSRGSMLYFFCGAIAVSIGLYFSWVYYNGYDDKQIHNVPLSVALPSPASPTDPAINNKNTDYSGY